MQNKIFVSIAWKGSFPKAVPIFCVQRISSVQRIIVFLVIYTIAWAEFPTRSSVGATLVCEQANGVQLPTLTCSLLHTEPRQGKQAGYGHLTDLAFSAFHVNFRFTCAFKPSCTPLPLPLSPVKNDHETPWIINMFCVGTLDKTVVLLVLLDSISSLILPCKSYFAFLLHTYTEIMPSEKERKILRWICQGLRTPLLPKLISCSYPQGQ